MPPEMPLKLKTTLQGIKKHQNFCHQNLKKSEPILISFGTNFIHWPSNDCLVSHLTHCPFLHYLGKENEQYIAS